MSTERQKALARTIVENSTLDKPLNGGEMLEKVGYSPNLVKQPGRIIEADGVQEELERLGFTEYNAKSVVSEILLDSEADKSSRLKAADMVFKVQGSYAPEKKDVALTGTIESTRGSELAKEFEERLKETL